MPEIRKVTLPVAPDGNTYFTVDGFWMCCRPGESFDWSLHGLVWLQLNAKQGLEAMQG